MANFSFYCWCKVTPRKWIKDGPRPPKKASKKKPAGITEEWTGVEGYWNQPLASEWVLGYGDAFSDEKEAINWINSSDGDDWLKHAKSYSLAKFEIAVDQP